MRRFAFALAVVSLAMAANRCLAESTEADQQIAQAIVESLREHQQAGRLKGFDIDLNVENGRVVLTGNVTDEKQHNLAIDAARYAPGVKMVVNDLKIKGTTRQHPEQQATLPASTGGLLSGLRKAWGQNGSEQSQPAQTAAEETPAATTQTETAAADTSGKQIDRLANPDPLNQNDKSISSGYSAFTAGAAQSPVATVEQISGQPQATFAKPIASQPAEQIVATSGGMTEQPVMSAWQTRQEIKPIHEEPTQVAQAVASNVSPMAQTASLNAPEAQPPQLTLPQATAPQAVAQPVQQQQAPQVQAVQIVPVPVQYYQQMQRPQGVPVAYTASRLPGGAYGQVRMAQAAAPQQIAPAPQFIQGTGNGIVPARYDHPNMPGYAWPAYASHPNYAALQYPKQYSAHAWPYIGPFYPYPQVPMGWRKVTLSWDDGWWSLDFKDRGYGPYVTH